MLFFRHNGMPLQHYHPKEKVILSVIIRHASSLIDWQAERERLTVKQTDTDGQTDRWTNQQKGTQTSWLARWWLDCKERLEPLSDRLIT